MAAAAACRAAAAEDCCCTCRQQCCCWYCLHLRCKRTRSSRPAGYVHWHEQSCSDSCIRLAEQQPRQACITAGDCPRQRNISSWAGGIDHTTAAAAWAAGPVRRRCCRQHHSRDTAPSSCCCWCRSTLVAGSGRRYSSSCAAAGTTRAVQGCCPGQQGWQYSRQHCCGVDQGYSDRNCKRGDDLRTAAAAVAWRQCWQRCCFGAGEGAASAERLHKTAGGCAWCCLAVLQGQSSSQHRPSL